MIWWGEKSPVGFYASNVGFSTRSRDILIPLSLTRGVTLPRIIQSSGNGNAYTPEGNTAERNQTRSKLLRQSANQMLREVRVFIAELHVDRRMFRDKNQNLCQNDVEKYVE